MLQRLGVLVEMIWSIIALYELVIGRVRAPGGMMSEITSTIGVKQGFPLSPTLFGLYIDEISEFVERIGGPGAPLVGILIPLLLYVDDIVLVSDSAEGLQRHLDALQEFCLRRNLTMNFGKTKVMVFNTFHAWLKSRSTSSFSYKGEMVDIVHSYVYLEVMFTGPCFFMVLAADAQLTRGYTTLALLERQCFQAHFQEPRTKHWLFDTLVTPAFMYGAPLWGPDVLDEGWRKIERP